MAQSSPKLPALFITTGNTAFEDRVENALASHYNIHKASLAELPSVLILPAIVVIALSSGSARILGGHHDLALLKLDVPYCIIFPDGDPIESNQTLERFQLQLIDAQRQLHTLPLSAFPDFLERRPYQKTYPVADEGLHRQELLISDFDSFQVVLDPLIESPMSDISIEFDPSLSPEQVKATLTALANYYRVCGGVGLSVEFENQEAVSEEVHV